MRVRAAEEVRVAIIGASGYAGGELLRLLTAHPEVEVVAAVSRKYAGEFVYNVHPNLRGIVDLKFVDFDEERLSECDFAFMAVPHGVSATMTPGLLDRGMRVVDLSADFRLKEAGGYLRWYGWKHPCAELLEKAVYGLPELHRAKIRDASLVACPGCMAVAAILAMAPIVKEGLVEFDKIVVDAKIGSTGAGSTPSLATHHPERFGVVRPYKLAGHRHTAEIEQELSQLAGASIKLGFSAHAVNIVRGMLATCHCFLRKPIGIPEVWKAYRQFYREEPFVRLVRARKGIYRLPDPKVVAGSNFCDIGFEVDGHTQRLVIVSAIDNLMKGAAGNAVQCFNIMAGFDERLGLEFAGFHPV